MTEQGIGRVLAVLAEEFGMEFTETRTAIWVAAFADISDEEGLQALALHLRRSRFAPHPADLIATVRGEPKDIERFLDEDAEDAIRHLEAGLSDYEAVDLGLELNVVVRLMGGPDAIVAEIASGQWRFRREEARRLYKRLRREGVPPEVLILPEWPTRPHRVETAADIPTIQPRVFPVRAIPGLPAPILRPALPEGGA